MLLQERGDAPNKSQGAAQGYNNILKVKNKRMSGKRKIPS